jgi:hypothetical protein
MAIRFKKFYSICPLIKKVVNGVLLLSTMPVILREWDPRSVNPDSEMENELEEKPHTPLEFGFQLMQLFDIYNIWTIRGLCLFQFEVKVGSL